MKTNSLFPEVQYFTKSLYNCSGDEYVLYKGDRSLRECAFFGCDQILHNILESIWERANCGDLLLFQASKNSQQSIAYKSLEVCHFSVTCENFFFVEISKTNGKCEIFCEILNFCEKQH